MRSGLDAETRLALRRGASACAVARAVAARRRCPPCAQTPRRRPAIEISAQADRGLRPARPVAPRVRRARVPRRAGARPRRTGIRRHLGDPRRADGARFIARHRQGPLAARAHRLSTARARSASPMPRWRRSSGPTARRCAARGWYDTEALAEDGGTVYVGIERVHRDRALRLRQGRPAGARPADRGAARRSQSLPHNKGIECLVFVPKGLPLAGTLIAISERGLDAAGNILGFLIGGPSPARSRSSAATTSTSAIARVTPGGDLLVLERSFCWTQRRRDAHPPRAARATIKPGALVDGAGADRGRHGLPDRQHGRPVGAPRSRRRAGADADLGRQFLAAAAHAAAAVHAGRRSDARRSRGREAARAIHGRERISRAAALLLLDLRA